MFRYRSRQNRGEYDRAKEMNFAQNAGEIFSSPKAVKRTIVEEEYYKRVNRLKSATKVILYSATIGTLIYLLTSCSPGTYQPMERPAIEQTVDITDRL